MLRRAVAKLVFSVLLLVLVASASPKAGPVCYCPSEWNFEYIFCYSWCASHGGKLYASCQHLGPYMCDCVDGMYWYGYDAY